jgi:hypothetical protein
VTGLATSASQRTVYRIVWTWTEFVIGLSLQVSENSKLTGTEDRTEGSL